MYPEMEVTSSSELVCFHRTGISKQIAIGSKAPEAPKN